MKDEVKIYDKLDKKIIKKFTISTIQLKLTILKNKLLFYTILHNIKIYYFLLFIYVPTYSTKT